MISLFIVILLILSSGTNTYSFLLYYSSERNVVIHPPIILSITIKKGISMRINERNVEQSKEGTSVTPITKIPPIISKQNILHYPQYFFTDNSTLLHP